MNVQEQITKYITSQAEPKRSDMQELHRLTLQVLPEYKLWFLDGKNGENQTVSNPNIGYGLHTMKYANGTTREFYQIGMSANKTGISVYIMGIKDKTYLTQTYGNKIGKASVSGYCMPAMAKFPRPASCTSSPVSIHEIGARWGFRDHGYFHRAFKKQFGITPTDARGTARQATEEASSLTGRRVLGRIRSVHRWLGSRM